MPNWPKILGAALYIVAISSLILPGLSQGLGNHAATILAESIHLTATVPAEPSDFQLDIQRINGSGLIPPDTEVTYALMYGSYLSRQTDIIVLQVSWSRGQIDDGSGNLVDIVSYVPGSSTYALGGSAPVVDVVNRTITWQISPMPAVSGQLLTWKLKTNHAYTGDSHVLFNVAARLIGPGTEKLASPLSNGYADHLPPTPTPTPTPDASPTPDATSSATPSPTTQPPPPPADTFPPPFNSLQPVIDAIENIPIIGKPIKEIADKAAEIAQDGGSLVVAPAPLLLTLIPALSTLFSLIAHVPWWQLPALLGALFWDRKRRPWGVVYDSATKQPLDPVLLVLVDSQGRSYQTVSDIYGRYQFLVEPGRYTLSVKRSNYTFPATSLNNQPTDGVYQDLFYGGEIEVTDATAINYNIPMDPVAKDWNQQKKVALGLTGSLHLPKGVTNWLFWAGFAWSLMMILLALTVINVAVICVYSLLILLRYISRWRHPWGVIYDSGSQPIAAAAVHLVDLRHPQLRRPPVVTKASGRYAYLVDEGDYQVNISLKMPYGYGAPILGPKISITGKQGTISQDIVIEKN